MAGPQIVGIGPRTDGRGKTTEAPRPHVLPVPAVAPIVFLSRIDGGTAVNEHDIAWIIRVTIRLLQDIPSIDVARAVGEAVMILDDLVQPRLELVSLHSLRAGIVVSGRIVGGAPLGRGI